MSGVAVSLLRDFVAAIEAMMPNEGACMIDPEAVLNQYHQPVPRYTSYPTAPQFQVGTGLNLFNNSLSALDPSRPVSAYIHIPFCDRLCWFCGCHTKHTLKYAPIEKYLGALARELKLFIEHFTFRPVLGQLHIGGGSPSLLKPEDLVMLRDALEMAFEFTADTEISIEIDPSDVSDDTVAALARFGLTRASIGVQDFHPEVQAAINRPQSFEITRDVVKELRNVGVQSINIDALYGLPLQSQARLLRTIEQCISLDSDRLALFGYAHVPWLKKHQKLINSEELPGSLERFYHAQAASVALQSMDYVAIGIDHFARPEDPLAQAMRKGTLRRNFQGYTTDSHETMIGIGASSIGRFANGYVQNTVPTHEYEAQVASGTLPKSKGLALSEEDRLRSHIIERLMCDFTIDFAEIKKRSPVIARKCLREAQIFAGGDKLGLCWMNGRRFGIVEEARPFTRIVAAQFDTHYRPERFQYSRVV